MVIALTVAVVWDVQAQESARHALVIGIDRYDGLARQLKLAVRDARLVASSLSRVDPAFQVRIVENGTRQEVDQELDAFGKAARGADCALVYFAGHGVEFQGDNFLLTRDTKLQTISADVSRAKRQMGNASVSLQTIMDDLEATGAGLTVVVLDACRNNPLEMDLVAPDGNHTRSAIGGAAGLGQVSAPSGMFVAYAADAGQEANDGLFTPILCKHLTKPGLDIVSIFAETRQEVRDASFKMQQNGSGVYHEPADYSKLNPAGTRFVFSRAAPVPLLPVLNPVTSRIGAWTEKLKEELLKKARAPETANGAPVAAPYTNSLGMKFVPVPETKVLMSIWETRVQDFKAFRMKTEGDADHPVDSVSWEDAKGFCVWLTQKEGRTYRLPTDHEWSLAVGIGDRESPKDRDPMIKGVYPWGTLWPPPNGAGNYAASLECDPFNRTSPVGAFPANRLGIFDLGGNVSEWCEDWDESHIARVQRGGSWGDYSEVVLNSSYRGVDTPTRRDVGFGFRCVLEVKSAD